MLLRLPIAVVALLVLVAVAAAVAVVDLRHDGFENKEPGGGVGGEGAVPSSQGVGRIYSKKPKSQETTGATETKKTKAKNPRRNRRQKPRIQKKNKNI